MKWYVFKQNFNTKEVEQFNVFDHYRFNEEVKELLSLPLEYDEFSERLQRTAQYYFWCRCEYEVYITGWPYHIKDGDLVEGHKVDIYSQLLMNWQNFLDYVVKYTDKDW